MHIFNGRRRIRLKSAVVCCCVLVLVSYVIFLWSTGPLDALFYGNLPPEEQMLSRPQRRTRQKILELSRRYVSDLVNDMSNDDEPIDHLYLKRSRDGTNFDLKKTLAVLLYDMIHRLDRVDASIADLQAKLVNFSLDKSVGQKSDFPKLQSVAGAIPAEHAAVKDLKRLFEGEFESCSLPKDFKIHYPNCQGKIEWMKTFWRSDPCYAQNGVDGSDCSILIYLSEVEHHCPVLQFRQSEQRPQALYTSAPAVKQRNLDDLFALMKDNPVNFEWIKGRLRRLWPKWLTAYDRLEAKQGWTLHNRPRKRIFLHLGLLTKESGFKFGEKSFKGGPLGELVQWSDLMAALYILGHDLVISSEIKTFLDYAKADPALKSSCPVPKDREHVGIIYTDIVGLRQIKKKMQASLQNYKCRLRVLDSFGTQADYNLMNYYIKHKKELSGVNAKSKNVWGGHGLFLKQFYTMYPHSSDNTFLGFVVESHESPNATISSEGSFTQIYSRQQSDSLPWALVYGKEAYMWKGKHEMLNSIADLVQIHATVAEPPPPSKKTAEPPVQLPSFVINHGVQSGPEFHDLLKQSSIFLGLGFPYEGPAPLEALANGAVYINPKFLTPKSRLTDRFFADKPTFRALQSQNPYTEDFVGAPYVLTVDINNRTALRQAVAQALSTKISPFLPYEFTHDGLLERLNAFIEQQDFCSDLHTLNWPPFSALQLRLAQPNVSCQDTCWGENLICEPTYFPKINNDQSFATFLPSLQNERLRHLGDVNAQPECAKVVPVLNTHAPSILARNSHAECYLQSHPLLFSCAGQSPDVHRICPCRDFIKGQSALCAACL